MAEPFRTKTPRKTTATVAKCFGDPQLFEREITPAVRAEMAKNGPIPCAGGGVPGVWCETCRFGVVADPIEIEGV